MWVFAVIGLGVFAISWIASRTDSRVKPARSTVQAEREIAALRCDLESSMRDATRWFEMDLPKPAWDSISDAFAILEALKSRIDRAEWSTLQSALLAAVPRALDAQPRPSRKIRRRARRRSRSMYV